jgi:hypothetical protein
MEQLQYNLSIMFQNKKHLYHICKRDCQETPTFATENLNQERQ